MTKIIEGDFSKPLKSHGKAEKTGPKIEPHWRKKWAENDENAQPDAVIGPKSPRKPRKTRKRPELAESRVIVDMKNRATGEALGYFIDSLGHKPKDKDWVKLFKGLAKAVAEDTAWPADLRVFMFFVWQLEYGNFMAFSRRDIAEQLCIARNTVNRAIARMVENLLVQEDIYKGASGFRFNPNYVHMGTDAQQAARRAEWAAMMDAKTQRSLAKPGMDIDSRTDRATGAA